VSKRKVRLNRQKIFLSPMSKTRSSNEEKFCVPTLEKEGSHGANSAGTTSTGKLKRSNRVRGAAPAI
ncbi:MAG: hypothetical protein IJG80_01540, partial [Selenomonadaceae bacterium]|nr:hypothetical protein [Selenomonadaceae bacterium]